MRKVNRPEDVWAKVSKDSASGCWLWTGAVNKDGYGKFSYQNRSVLAHRVAWLAAHGRWPDGCVCHHCDTPACCNPTHLFEGSAANNRADCVQKTRQAKGIRQHKARLTDDIVREIRRLYSLGESQQTIADLFETPQTNVSCIVRMKTWKHVT